MDQNIKIGIVGLGYVGLPLAVEFGKKYTTIGYDINHQRISSLNNGIDSTQETSEKELLSTSHLSYTTEPDDLNDVTIFIITVPTPIDRSKNPDLTPVKLATELVAGYLKPQDIVIYESTVYPGATEEICVPILERISDLTFNEDFFCGYSPERINPGDKERRLTTIVKVTSGSTPESAEIIDNLYQSIIKAGTHKASSLKVAEAAKVIENVQRDTNIALMNELALIFNRVGIDTEEVLKAAGTKWNFLPFSPGLVGGHCIGIDPYYLVHKAEELGYHPHVISASRRVNDDMGLFIVGEIVKLMAMKSINIVESKVLMLGLTFKENCPDLRNTRVVEMVDELKLYNTQLDIYDPWARADEAKHEYGIELISKPQVNYYDCIIIAVAHQQFKELGASGIKAFANEKHVIYDIKYLLKSHEVDGRL